MFLKAYWDNPEIYLIYELNVNGAVIQAGDPIRIKRQRGQFRFTRLVADIAQGKEWAECLDMRSGKYRKFYLDQIIGPSMKRSRSK